MNLLAQGLMLDPKRMAAVQRLAKIETERKSLPGVSAKLDGEERIKTSIEPEGTVNVAYVSTDKDEESMHANTDKTEKTSPYIETEYSISQSKTNLGPTDSDISPSEFEITPSKSDTAQSAPETIPPELETSLSKSEISPAESEILPFRSVRSPTETNKSQNRNNSTFPAGKDDYRGNANDNIPTQANKRTILDVLNIFKDVYSNTLKAYSRLLRTRKLLFFLLFRTLADTGFLSTTIFLPAYASEQGLPASSIPLTLSLLGATELISRLLLGYLGDFRCVSKVLLLSITLFICGTVTMILSFVKSVLSVYMVTICRGLFGGTCRMYTGPILAEIVSFELLGRAISLAVSLGLLGFASAQVPFGKCFKSTEV